MAILTVTEVLAAGVAPTLVAAAAGGDSVTIDDRTLLYVKNAGGSPCTVTIAVQRPSFVVPGLGKVDFTSLAVVVPATTGERFIKIPTAPYADGNGRAQISYSGVTSVTIGAFKLPAGG
jgi:hypothetical protein